MLWQGLLQAFFMGLLFFLAGVFSHSSLERRGTLSFLGERTRRLGAPSFLYMLLIQPLIIYVLLGSPHKTGSASLFRLYGNYLTSGRLVSGSGPMWFALALLAFSVLLVIWRIFRAGSASGGNPSTSEPGIGALLLFGGGLVLTTFLVRLVQPLGTNVLNFQLCFFPQYVLAFAAGVAAGRGGWLEALATSRVARMAGRLGLIGGPICFALIAFVGGPPPENGPNLYAGGWNLRAFVLAAWEQLTGLGIALGCLAWFRAHGDTLGNIRSWLADRAFGVYALHAPILVALTPWLRPAVTNPFIGALLLTVVGLVASYVVAELARRTPLLRGIL